jgi:hypothetical protein
LPGGFLLRSVRGASRKTRLSSNLALLDIDVTVVAAGRAATTGVDGMGTGASAFCSGSNEDLPTFVYIGQVYERGAGLWFWGCRSAAPPRLCRPYCRDQRAVARGALFLTDHEPFVRVAG